MTKANVLFSQDLTRSREGFERQTPSTTIDRILQKLACLDIPAKDHLESYMLHKWRLNHKGRTLYSSFHSIILFLAFLKSLDKSRLEEATKEDLEAFIEHEQDRGLNITTIRTRLACLIAFLHFLIEEEALPGPLLKKSIKLKLPEALPRAIIPSDVKRLLSVINDTQDRALFLILLRTGMRIGEALSLTVNDLDVRERKIHLFVGEKNSQGRVVYLSDDALFALKRWLRQRDQRKEQVFYTRGHTGLSYSTAPMRVKNSL